MSGPKSGHVSVSDRQRLENERRDRELKESEELVQLRAEKAAKRIQEKQERRLKELEVRAQQRREREARRAEERAKQAELARQREVAQWQRIRGTLANALARRSELQRNFPGIELPAEPTLSEAPPTTIEQIRAACDEITRLAFTYQLGVDSAIAAWNTAQSAVESAAEMQHRAARYQSSAVRTAKDIVAVLESESGAAREGQELARINLRRRAAQNLLAQAGNGQPWQAHLELSSETLAALDGVMDANVEATAQTALLHLTQRLNEDSKRAEATYLNLERERGQAQVLKESHDKQREREMVAATIRDTLEDLGYEVSDIEETAFMRDGALYASRTDQPDHAVRMQIGEFGQLRVEPVRIVSAGETRGEADRARQAREDASFDRAFCSSKGGLGEFLSTARSRGLKATVSAVHEAGTQPVRTVDETLVGERVRQARRPTKQRQGPIARQLPPR